MAAKMLAAPQNIITNKQNQFKITKETLFSNFAAVVCVYWYLQRFTFSVLYENIRVKNVVDENILQNSVCLARKRFGVSFEFEK